MSKDSIYEFWNKVPGPGEYDRHQFAKIPQDATLWEGVRIGVTEYLGVRWVVEVVDKDNVVVRRTDQPIAPDDAPSAQYHGNQGSCLN